jgi:hypothetical protein
MSEDLLNRAAKRLREVAEAASPGGWRRDRDAFFFRGVRHEAVSTFSEDGFDAVALTGVFGEHPRSGPDADYIALMHPAVADSLARMLERLAPLAPYWHEAYAAPFVPIIEQGVRLAQEVLRHERTEEPIDAQRDAYQVLHVRQDGTKIEVTPEPGEDAGGGS